VTGTKFYYLVIEARTCEQLAHGHYPAVEWPGVKPTPCITCGPMCITVSNFIKIGQTVTEISRLKVFNIAAICHLRILKICISECTAIRVPRVYKHQRAKFHQNTCRSVTATQQFNHPPSWISGREFWERPTKVTRWFLFCRITSAVLTIWKFEYVVCLA